MPLRRSLVLRASIVAAAMLGSAAAAADERAPEAPPPPAPTTRAKQPIHVSVDLLAGLVYRLGAFDSFEARGGGMLGVDVLVGHKPWYSAGLGYERTFFGREQADAGPTTFSKVNRSLDTLWILGRVYPYLRDPVGVFVQLGLGPSWQGVNTSGTKAVTDASGQLMAQPYSCSAHSSAGLSTRVGGGVEISLTSLISFTAGIGIDHLDITGKTIGGCAYGSGSQTALTARAGLTFTTGREPPPPPPALPPTPPPPPDRDGDGILDNVDACADVRGVPNADPKKHGCPPPSDRDRDNIFDEQDACPDEPGVVSDDLKKNGCPPPKDRDDDGILDEQDACPDIKGVQTADPATNGCPPDTDGDGLRDDKDACPKEKGVPNAEDPSKNGCPLVQVTEKEIIINQQVQFEVDRALIRPASDPLLDQVAAMIRERTEIQKLEVQGHTDNSGGAQRNKILSQSRADSVKKALVKRGISERKLEAKGYGQEQPIAENDTEAGKAKNRRVQFKILQKKDPSAPGSDATKKPDAPKPGDKPVPAPAPIKKPDAPKPSDKPVPAPTPVKKPDAPKPAAPKPGSGTGDGHGNGHGNGNGNGNGRGKGHG